MFQLGAHIATGNALPASVATLSSESNDAANGVSVLLVPLLAILVVLVAKLAAVAIRPATERVKAYMGAIWIMGLMLLVTVTVLSL